MGASLVEASLDLGHVEAGARRLPLCELELELQQGSPKALVQLARRWLLPHGLWLSAEAKSERGRRLLHGEAQPAVVTAQPPQLHTPMSPEALVQALVANCLAQILPNAAAVAGGNWGDEHVHQLRVGLRRLRTVLRELGGLSSRLPQRIDAPLTAAFRQLGAHRDRQTVLAAITPQLLAAGAAGVGWASAEADETDLAQIVQAPAFQCALLDALAFSLTPGPGAPQNRKALRKLVQPRLRRLHTQVSEGGRRFGKLPLAEQHRVRKRLKRLRYLSEFVAPLFGGEATRHYLEALHPAQDALGEHNDMVVAHALAQPLASGDADARFATDWLARTQRKTARKASKHLAKVARSHRFWKKR
jgi:inorganic triphosphatase YgiF